MISLKRREWAGGCDQGQVRVDSGQGVANMISPKMYRRSSQGILVLDSR